MNTVANKKRVELRLGEDVLKVLGALGAQQKRSLKNYMELLLEGTALSQPPEFVKQALKKK